MSDDKRVKRFNLRLSLDMAERLEKLAEEQGIAPTTLAAVYVGQMVRQTEAQSNMVLELMKNPDFIRQAASLIDGEK